MKCINCGHGSYRNVFSKPHFDEIYGAEYAKDYLDATETHNQRLGQYVLDLILLKELLSEKIKVLDFGCSSGEYLDAMPDAWDKSGYEVNSKQVSDIKECFDLITLRGVIEHIPKFSIFSELISKQLKVGGILYISATPDFSSPCAVEYKSHWGQIHYPSHIHQFTPASLQILLSTSGLVMKGLYHPYMGTPYENWKNDSAHYLKNSGIKPFTNLISNEVKSYIHPFPGNMMSVIFEKVA